jgi:hypothetical protein
MRSVRRPSGMGAIAMILKLQQRAIIKGGEDMIREIEQEKEDIKSLDCSGVLNLIPWFTYKAPH